MHSGRGLRANFVWTVAGNAVYGASQWALLSLIAKVGSADMLGRYALAVSVATPPMMLAHLNLRSVLATDVQRSHPFGDYLLIRVMTAALALTLMIWPAFLSGMPALILLTGVSLAFDNVSDIYHAPMQRDERMENIGISLMLRGVLSVVAAASVLLATNSLIATVAALVVVRIAILVFWDHPRGSRAELLRTSDTRAQWEIVRTALPLGGVLLLVSLITHLPRYAIARYLGTEELGVFAAIASFIALGHMFTNSLGQSATPRLARFFHQRDLRRFRQDALRLVAFAAALGAVAVACAFLLGEAVLTHLYRPEYARFNHVLVATMAASIVVYSGSTLGYVNTATRAFRQQLPLLGAAALACGLLSFALVPRIELFGPPVALAAAALIQIAGHLYILRQSLREVVA